MVTRDSLNALIGEAKNNRLWAITFIATLILPIGLIFARTIADAACVTIGIVFLVHSIRNKQWQWLNDLVVRASLLAWGWLVFVVTPLAVAPVDSFAASAPWIRYVLLYAALRHFVLLSPQTLKLVATFIFYMLVLVAIDTFWQYLTGISLTGNVRDDHGRLSGPMTNVKVGIFSAKMLVPAAAIALFYVLLEKSKPHFMLLLGVVLLVMTTILLSGERAAFIYSFGTVTLTLLFLGYAEPALRKKISLVFIFLLTLVAATYITQPWVQQRTEELRLMLIDYPNSEYGKLAYAGYKIGVENFLHGVGFKGFRVVCDGWLQQGVLTVCNLHPHNIYLEWFAEAGVVGLSLLIAMILAFFITAIKVFHAASGIYRIPSAVAISMLLIAFAPFMPSQSSYSNWPSLLFWYSTALLFAGVKSVPLFTSSTALQTNKPRA